MDVPERASESLQTFAEQFSLSRLGAIISESALKTVGPEAIVAVVAAEAAPASDTQLSKSRLAVNKSLPAVAIPRPSLKRRSLQPATTQTMLVKPQAPRADKRFPIFSTVAERLPCLRNMANSATLIANSVSNVGRRIGLLFTRSCYFILYAFPQRRVVK